eukprot:SAG11_NODE_827_length_6974_cov_4.300945_1_plen_307_part_00
MLLTLAAATAAAGAQSWCTCSWHGPELMGGLASFVNDTRDSPYNRLPAIAGPGGADAAKRVSDGPWRMSRAPAGGFLQFTTDATLLYLNATVLAYLGGPVTNLDTSLLGWAGMDVYARADGAACNITGPDGGCWRHTASASTLTFRPAAPAADAAASAAAFGTATGELVGEMKMVQLTIPCAAGCTSSGAPPLNANASYRGANHTFRLHLPTHVELLSVGVGKHSNGGNPFDCDSDPPNSLTSVCARARGSVCVSLCLCLVLLAAMQACRVVRGWSPTPASNAGPRSCGTELRSCSAPRSRGPGSA